MKVHFAKLLVFAISLFILGSCNPISKNLSNENPRQKILFISGDLHKLDKYSTLSNLPYLEKPFRLNDLYDILDDI